MVARKGVMNLKLVRVFIAFVVVSLFVGIGSAFNGQSYSEDNLNDFHKSVDKIEIGNDISTEIVDKETVNEEQLQPADNNNSFSESNEKTTSKKQQSVKKNETKTTNTNNSNSNSNVNPSENTTQIQENKQDTNESTQSVETKETTNISISSNDDYRINKDEWLKTENHHKAIVKKEIFLQVNKMIFDRGLRTSNDGKYYKYSGFLKCGDCKNNMYRTNKRYKKADTVYYYCGNYQNNRTCSSHCIKEIEIDEVVEDCARRELYEEMGLVADELEFLCVNSGPEAHYVYPNGDEVSNFEIVYICRRWHGEVRMLDGEMEELRFFSLEDIDLMEISPPIRPVMARIMGIKNGLPAD